MTDTQWPRFEVFQQDRPGRPHQHAGSVHAPDSELALLNARDVFVRRPECASLWVAPAAAVSAATAQEKAASQAAPQSDESVATAYLVFAKLEQKGSLVHVGTVSASGPRAALTAAAGSAQAPMLVAWVIPEAAIIRSDPDQAEPFFSPALDKPFRDQAYYRVQTALRHLRRDSGR